MSVRRIASEATHDLRHRILRPDQRIGELARPGDDDPMTGHYGSFEGERLVAVATVMPETEPDPSTSASGPEPQALRGDWRIRGVAAEPDVRGRGHGRAVIEACIEHAARHGGTIVWLNGRVSSEPFYRALGFAPRGEPFDTPPSGLHHRFRRAV